MSVQFTTNRFPKSLKLKKDSGIPWGCVVQPFASIPAVSETDISSDLIPRCQRCFAYINRYVRFTRSAWKCPLCENTNNLSERHASSLNREALPELKYDVIEYDLVDEQDPDTSSIQADEQKGEEEADTSGNLPPKTTTLEYPVYLFVVDVSGSAEFIELVKSGILAALETLPDEALIGLIVFSSSIGLYNLRSEVPYVRYTRIPAKTLPHLPLDQVLPLEKCLVRLGPNKETIAQAVESIQSSSDPANFGIFDSKQRENALKHAKRGLGTCLMSLLGFLNLKENELYARLMLFLSGAPNWGLGRLDQKQKFPAQNNFNSEEKKRETTTENNSSITGSSPNSPDNPHSDATGPTGASGVSTDTTAGLEAKASGMIMTESQYSKWLSPQTNFYRDLSEIAATNNLCIDLYCVSDGAYLDLASIKFLSIQTGGNILLYNSTKDSSLPQDLFKQLRKSQAFAGLFRVRTSTCFQVASVYGHLCPHKEFEHVYHIPGCDARKSFCLDFEFLSADRFNDDSYGIVQIAFAYTGLLNMSGADDEENVEEGPVPVRRLRVMTFRVDCAHSCRTLHANVASEAVVSLLTSQLIHVAIDRGIKEARLLLEDWLINLVVSVVKGNEKALQAQNGRSVRPKRAGMYQLKHVISTDGLLTSPGSLVFMTRFIFVMLKHSFLTTALLPPDQRVFQYCLMTALEPRYLCKSFYPTLSSFSDLRTPSTNVCHLSLASLRASEHHIFVIDGYTEVLIYYLSSANDSPLPPPQSSEVRKLVKRIKQHSPLISPKVMYTRENERNGRLFLSRLLEDDQGLGLNFEQFSLEVAEEVLKLLNGLSQ